MLSRLFSRSVRSLSVTLAAVALVLALAAPALAAPRQEAPAQDHCALDLPTRVAGQLFAWMGSAITALDASRASKKGEDVDSISSSSGSCVDPFGNTISCPDPD